jgi:hypothetical protein
LWNAVAYVGPPPNVPRRGLHLLALAVAIGLAAVAAFFSISGMTILFSGAPIAITVMAAAMEAGKLVGAAWLSANWRTTGDTLRAVLVALIATLALVNAVGVYGRLTAAHLSTHVAAEAATDQQATTVGARIEAQAHVVGDLDRRIGQVDQAVEESAKRGRGAGSGIGICLRTITRSFTVYASLTFYCR